MRGVIVEGVTYEAAKYASSRKHNIGHEEERENTTIMSALESQACVLERDKTGDSF
jgi:hypothetical protein